MTTEEAANHNYNPHQIKRFHYVNAQDIGDDILEMDDEITVAEVRRELGVTHRKAEAALTALEQIDAYDRDGDTYVKNGLPDEDIYERLSGTL